MVCFYFGMTLFEGGTKEAAAKEVHDKFWPTYKVNFILLEELLKILEFILKVFYKSKSILRYCCIQKYIHVRVIVDYLFNDWHWDYVDPFSFSRLDVREDITNWQNGKIYSLKIKFNPLLYTGFGYIQMV